MDGEIRQSVPKTTLEIIIWIIFRDKKNSVLTNITLQTFASESDAALIDQSWEEKGPTFLKRLFAAGLL